MRATIIAILALLAPAFAHAQPAWNDPTGRLSFDLNGTSWSLFPRDNAPNDVILNIVPEDVLNGGPVTRICSLEYKKQPLDRVESQAVANEMVRLAHSLDEANALAGKDVTPGNLIMHDGVAMQHIEGPVKHSTTGEAGLGITRDFILPGDHFVQYVGLNCTAYESGGPAAADEIRNIMNRPRIAAWS
jgi:hypothetical protein